jgi:hypothetical protein
MCYFCFPDTNILTPNFVPNIFFVVYGEQLF